MYINIYKIALLVCICGIGIFGISCSGNTDDSEQTEVILSVSKNSLIADGKDVITFTVMYAGIDVTADAVIRSVMDGKPWMEAPFLLLKQEPMLLKHLTTSTYPN